MALTGPTTTKSAWDSSSSDEERGEEETTKEKQQKCRHKNSAAATSGAAAAAALAFCRSIGLPTNDSHNIEESKVRFKVAPLQPLPPGTTLMRNDDFVFWHLNRTMTAIGNKNEDFRIDANGLKLPPQSWMELVLWGSFER